MTNDTVGKAMQDTTDMLEHAIELARRLFDDIASIKTACKGMAEVTNLSQKVKLYTLLIQMTELLDAIHKGSRGEKEYFENKAIPRQMEGMGIEKYLDADTNKMLEVVHSYSVKTVERERLFKWLKAVKAEFLIKPTVNSSSLRAFLRERFEEGKSDPPGDVATFDVISKVKITTA